MFHLFIIVLFLYAVSEYIGGGELFDSIRKFSYELVQLYVAEIALALGNLLFLIILLLFRSNFLSFDFAIEFDQI